MSNYRDAITQEVTSWENVSTAPHRFNAVEFNLALDGKTIELGHLHSGTLLDILFSLKIRDILMAEGRAAQHHILPDTGWTSFHIRNEADAENALWLLRLSYLHHHARSRRLSFDERGRIRGELDILNVSAPLRELFDGWLGR